MTKVKAGLILLLEWLVVVVHVIFTLLDFFPALLQFQLVLGILPVIILTYKHLTVTVKNPNDVSTGLRPLSSSMCGIKINIHCRS